MLLAVVFLMLSVAFGFGLVERLNFFDSVLKNFAFGAPVGISISSFTVLVLYALQRGFNDNVFYVSILIIALFVFVLYRNELSMKGLRKRKIKPTYLPKAVLYTIILVFAIIAFVLITSLYVSNNSLYCVGPQICSDLLYHIGVGNSVIYSGFPPKYPFTIDALNVFPFISDFYSALLMKYGLGLSQSIVIPDLILFFSAVAMTTEFAYAVLKNKFATLAAMLIFWFGSNFIMAFIIYPLNSTFPFIPSVFPPLPALLSYYGISATGLSALLKTFSFTLSAWTSIIYQTLLQSRGFVLALPIGVALIYFAYEMLHRDRKFTKAQLIFIGVIVGLLPLIHPVTLLALAFVFLYLLIKIVASKKERRERLKLMLFIVVPALILATPQILYMTSQSTVPGRYHFVYQDYYFLHGSSIVSSLLADLVQVPALWIEKIGIPLILAAFGYKFASKEARSFMLPFIALWIFLTVFSIQPENEDGPGFFLFVFLMMSVFDGYALAKLYSMKFTWKLIAVVLILCVIGNFPAVYAYWAKAPYEWVSSTEMNASSYARNSTSNSSIFAVSDYVSLLEPISSLGARQTLISIEIDMSVDEYTVSPSKLAKYNKEIFNTGNCTLIRSLNVSYIYLLSNSTNDTIPFSNQNFSQVFSQPDSLRDATIYIYKVLC
ncbi:MAG: hypothetical protein KGH57_03425 [Candidatus Micrarchaeota archaeon]|nr:hypothetical protein [Candidatus Micrarchaeota archaeon]